MAPSAVSKPGEPSDISDAGSRSSSPEDTLTESHDSHQHQLRDHQQFQSESLVNGSDTKASNGQTNGHTSISSTLHQDPNEGPLDLLCIGFGPASLAIAIALHDAHAQVQTQAQNSQTPPARMLFLEKQDHFAWHSGMQLPGAKMQISFLKDLATPRDPRSKFTFLNYLFNVGRLNQFINLGTFLPSRLEYEDYLRWCAKAFEKEGNVAYGVEVESVKVGSRGENGKVTSFDVTARGLDGELVARRANHVVIAVGGKPLIPQCLQGLKHMSHSSQYSNRIASIQEAEKGRRLRFAVVGSGQSAAEIFNDLWDRFPQAEIKLIIKGPSLRPSDDSPFVNEVFDPNRVDSIYHQHPTERAASIALDRGTNYGVVRLALLEHLYEKLYIQRLTTPNESQWRCRIIPNRSVVGATQIGEVSSSSNPSSSMKLKLKLMASDGISSRDVGEEELVVDYVFSATGYVRNAHESILEEVRDLLPEEPKRDGKFPVSREYRVQFDEDRIDSTTAGIWLQGCNESTHGLSDTLLSILAVRAGELVKSIFGSGNSLSDLWTDSGPLLP